jgi:hypothetical protein
MSSLPSLERKRTGGMSSRERMEREEEEARKRKQQQQQLPAINAKEEEESELPLDEITIELPDGKTDEINKQTKMMVLDAWYACEKGQLDYAVLAKWFIDSGRSNEWFRSVIEHRHRDYYYQLDDGTQVFPLGDRRSPGQISPFERLSKAIAREGRKRFDQLAFNPSRPPPQLRAKQSDRSIEDEKQRQTAEFDRRFAQAIAALKKDAEKYPVPPVKPFDDEEQKKLLKEQTDAYNRRLKQAVAARKKDIESHPILAARSRLIEKRSKGQIDIQNLPSKFGTSGQVDNEEEEAASDYGIKIDSLSLDNNGEEAEEETY